MGKIETLPFFPDSSPKKSATVGKLQYLGSSRIFPTYENRALGIELILEKKKPLSVYDMKNIFCLFERPFEIQKNGVFFSKYLFSFQIY